LFASNAGVEYKRIFTYLFTVVDLEVSAEQRHSWRQQLSVHYVVRRWSPRPLFPGAAAAAAAVPGDDNDVGLVLGDIGAVRVDSETTGNHRVYFFSTPHPDRWALSSDVFS